MSSAEQELKAGHPPAVKAGGMRITQHKSPKSHDKAPVDDGDMNNAALKVSTSPPKTVSISGAPVRGDGDFPTEAVKSFHEKPLPTHDNHANHRNQNHTIQQPRK